MWKEDEQKRAVEEKEKEKMQSLPIRHGKHHKSRSERKNKDKKKKGFNPY